MMFDSLAEFVAMGGHGLYVWLAYGALIVVLVGNLVAARGYRSRVLQEVDWLVRERARDKSGDDKEARG